MRLRGESGPVSGQTSARGGEPVTIGRQAGNTIVPNAGQLSRQHSRLDLQGDQVVVTDLGSANGTPVLRAATR
ncbi:MAG: hypothetical protein AVDCRST_MAG88-1330 [uncultured Thermomicrobiales bacterium]|uniref:FHA domain-containing protein n=1 Tax=uncultured Thermomicrobiales bacterium TaxID=1645740 RepID=A0A6J4UUV3_9BACT|nr:MAG: hypothetical protein AVDCRST_MAG88-1330 [uncultured Thermomicrobiales bacterium]